MKKKQWAQSFSLIDEKYVEEADPMRDAGRVSAVRRLRRRIITLAACAAAGAYPVYPVPDGGSGRVPVRGQRVLCRHSAVE